MHIQPLYPICIFHVTTLQELRILHTAPSGICCQQNYLFCSGEGQSLVVSHRRPVAGAVLFNIFISNPDSGIENTHSRFTDNTKLSNAIDAIQGKDAQRNLDRLLKWAHKNLMRFNKGQIQGIGLGLGQSQICI